MALESVDGAAGTIFTKLDRVRLALADASPAFDTFFGMNGIGLIFSDFVNFTRTDFGTVSAAITFFAVYHWIHITIPENL